MCVHCYKSNLFSFNSRVIFLFQFPKIFCKLIQRKYQRINNQYNHFWVSRTTKNKDGNLFYYANAAVKLKYNGADIGYSPIYSKKEYAEFMGAIFEVYQQPKNKPTDKMGYVNYIENVSLLKTLLLFPYVTFKIFKAKSIGTIFN